MKKKVICTWLCLQISNILKATEVLSPPPFAFACPTYPSAVLSLSLRRNLPNSAAAADDVPIPFHCPSVRLSPANDRPMIDRAKRGSASPPSLASHRFSLASSPPFLPSFSSLLLLGGAVKKAAEEVRPLTRKPHSHHSPPPVPFPPQIGPIFVALGVQHLANMFSLCCWLRFFALLPPLILPLVFGPALAGGGGPNSSQRHPSHHQQQQQLHSEPLQLLHSSAEVYPTAVNRSSTNGRRAADAAALGKIGPEGPPTGKWLGCEDAPDEWRRRTCIKLRQIDRKARQALTRRVKQMVSPPSMPGSPAWLKPIPIPVNHRGQIASHPFECMTLRCLCPFFKGKMRRDGLCYLPSGKPLSMAYRKEYRMLSDEERRRFHVAMNELKRQGIYRFFGTQHRRVATGGAHSGPAFLPWHREFVKRLEIALRLLDPSLAVPYWDSVMDNYLPDPRDSIFFSPMFAGDTDPNGYVVNGPFAFWRTLEGRAAILRDLGKDAQLFTERQLLAVANERNIWNVLSYTVPFRGCPIPTNFDALEYSHTNVHFWVGGDLATPELSANDPIFYMHHSFVDLIFEIWRQMQQSRSERENIYTANLKSCANEFHFSHSLMAPFNTLTNIDGLSNAYTDQLYRYALRPVKLGGNCRGFEGKDACFNGQCLFGLCQPGPTPPPWRPPSPTAPPRLQPMSSLPSSAPSPSSRSLFARLGAVAKRRQKLLAKERRRLLSLRGRIVAHADTIRESGQLSSSNELDTFSSLSNASISSAPLPIEAAEETESLPAMFNFNLLGNCFNRHPCCDHWAAQDECSRNPNYMQRFCQSTCHFCVAAYNRSDECQDRHLSCEQWASDGECGGQSHLFLEENCRKSCGLCALTKFDGSCSMFLNAAANFTHNR
ncbi:hypothetical protein niasHT_000385 [Heterodera trifolii]|uniref:ShKT domain-containing protein n=1 Tax=Heterodera trifolii TaxID=157864 RepID=A0ABD2M171_9BILA